MGEVQAGLTNLLSRVEAHPLIRERPFAAGPVDAALLADLVALGALDGAEPFLVRILGEHPLLAVRQASGTALSRRRTKAAHDALQASTEPALALRSLLLDPRARALARGDWVSLAAMRAPAVLEEPLRDEPFVEADPSEWGALPAHDERAQALADAIMETVARNADRVTERLARLGWPLGPRPRQSPTEVAPPQRNPFTGAVSARPPTVRAQLLDLAARTAAPVPLALATFWQVVGGIDWTPSGELPPWAPPAETIDPLVVAPASSVSHWLTRWESAGRRGAFALPFSTDSLHKAHGAGFGPYTIDLPTTDLDPVVRNAPEKLRFVPYLRNAFRWGGLPGLAYVDRSAELDAVIAQLTEGLEPF